MLHRKDLKSSNFNTSCVFGDRELLNKLGAKQLVQLGRIQTVQLCEELETAVTVVTMVCLREDYIP
jgi:hypothetical protein